MRTYKQNVARAKRSKRVNISLAVFDPNHDQESGFGQKLVRKWMQTDPPKQKMRKGGNIPAMNWPGGK